jgi:hypothetical protein
MIANRPAIVAAPAEAGPHTPPALMWRRARSCTPGAAGSGRSLTGSLPPGRFAAGSMPFPAGPAPSPAVFGSIAGADRHDADLGIHVVAAPHCGRKPSGRMPGDLELRLPIQDADAPDLPVGDVVAPADQGYEPAGIRVPWCGRHSSGTRRCPWRRDRSCAKDRSIARPVGARPRRRQRTPLRARAGASGEGGRRRRRTPRRSARRGARGRRRDPPPWAPRPGARYRSPTAPDHVPGSHPPMAGATRWP